MEDRKNQAYRVGVTILLLLAVLTIGEYFIGSIAIGWWMPLILIAILKAFLVIRDYMHIGRLFGGEEVQK